MCVIVVKELLFEVSRLQYTLWDGTAPACAENAPGI